MGYVSSQNVFLSSGTLTSKENLPSQNVFNSFLLFHSHPFSLTLLLASLLLVSLFHITRSEESPMHKEPPVFGFWHIGIVGSYMDVISDQLSQLQRACFLTDFTFIRLLSTNATRTDVEWFIRTHPASEKLGTVLFTYGNETEGHIADTSTSWLVRKLTEYVTDDAIVWFMHNKGSTHGGKVDYENVGDWRRMMMYFLFEKDWCYRALREDFYDTCGSNMAYSITKHYSGTFWMAHARYVKTLPYASMFWSAEYHQPPRLAGEVWLLHSDLPSSRILCVHDSRKLLYFTSYPRSVYEQAVIGHGCEDRVKPEFLAALQGSVNETSTV